MHLRLLEILRCPDCRGLLKPISFEEADGEISSGLLSCVCGSKYPIWKRVPRMLSADSGLPAGFAEAWRDRLSVHAAELLNLGRDWEPDAFSFSTQWAMYEYGQYRWEFQLRERVKYFYQHLQLEPGSLNFALVLDAGCGNGSLSAAIAASGPEVVAMDYSNSVEHAEDNKTRFAGEAASKVHYIQGDIQRPPFSMQIFDVIYSEGVLHHTPDTHESFKALAPLVKKGGRFFVWVYRSDLRGTDRLRRLIIESIWKMMRPVPLRVVKIICWGAALVIIG